MQLQPIIETERLGKTYHHGTKPALEEVSLRLMAGERLGLIGGNGSGKTTLIRLLLNFIRPDTGRIRLFGTEDLEAARSRIGYIPERQSGLENFTPKELLSTAAAMQGMALRETGPRIQELLNFAGLGDVADNLLSDFSKGMSQRVMICHALIHRPALLLLDEPLSGLDPTGRQEVGDLLMKLQNETMIYASHHLEEIERFCTSVVILREGRLVARLEVTDLDAEIYTIDLPPEAFGSLTPPAGIEPEIVHRDDQRTRVQFTAQPAAAQRWFAELNRHNVQLLRIRSRGVLELLYAEHNRS